MVTQGCSSSREAAALVLQGPQAEHSLAWLPPYTQDKFLRNLWAAPSLYGVHEYELMVTDVLRQPASLLRHLPRKRPILNEEHVVWPKVLNEVSATSHPIAASSDVPV